MSKAARIGRAVASRPLFRPLLAARVPASAAVGATRPFQSHQPLPSQPALKPSSSSPPSSSERRWQDADLREYFDHFSAGMPSTSTAPSGLFGHAQLRRPHDFPALVQSTVTLAQVMVDDICASAQSQGTEDIERAFLALVGKLDRLSDTLCRVIDLAELVRNAHPDRDWVEAANYAYSELCEYMNVLNTDVRLYEALKALHSRLDPSSPKKSARLYAAHGVAVPFLRDFEKSGIHLPSAQRDRFVQLSTDIISLGREFWDNITSSSAEGSGRAGVELTAAELGEGVGFSFAKFRLLGGADKGVINPLSNEGRFIARQHPVSKLREVMYRAANTSRPEEVEVLEELLSTRSALARLVGRESWAEMALEDKMAHTESEVSTFLRSLNASTRPLARANVQRLAALKTRHLGPEQAKKEGFNAWDRDFYTDLAAGERGSMPDLSPFFSIGTCLQGLSRTFTSLYGVSFEVEDLAPGEAWDSGVRKVAVMDEDEGRIGTIYFDLAAREGKPQGAAHYTVQCSRRVDWDAPLAAGADQGTLGVQEVTYRGREGRHQLPVVVLVCNFGAGQARKDGAPTLLQWGEVETLFHEMGHAMHSMIGRTEYHNVAGTRCPTDFVELPSIMMEHFLSSPSILALFARHHETGHPVPGELITRLLEQRNEFSALETSSQIMMAALDQAYHAAPEGSRIDTTKVLEQTQQAFHVLPYVQGTSWQTSFGHLYGYGATYYSYLLDRALSARIFSRNFASDPTSREAGEQYKNKVLKWGGGKDPWEMVGDAVDDAVVREGGRAAMKEVGTWGVDEVARGA